MSNLAVNKFRRALWVAALIALGGGPADLPRFGGGQPAAICRSAYGAVTAEQLRKHIARLVSDIKSLQRPDGSWSEGPRGSLARWVVGQSAVAVLALSSAGLPADDPAIAKGVRYLVGHDASQTYTAAVKLSALAAVDAKEYRREIARLADYLIRIQHESGGWSYGDDRSREDNSNSQFALLALDSAARCGVAMPHSVWEKARTYYARRQNRDGGWGYLQGGSKSYGSMTAAGTASLYLCDLHLHVRSGKCGVYPDDRRFKAGLAWLAKNFSVTRNPRHERFKFYYLYSLERVGVICARRYLGSHDWYREGVEHLVGDREQVVTAGAGVEGKLIRDCWMLLFLVKGNAPVLIHKASWAGAWNEHRYDARFVVDFIGKQLGRQLSWQIVPLSAPLDHLTAAPILYISGKGEAHWTAEELGNLKKYVEAGGFVFAEANSGDQAFDRSFRRILKEILPDQELAPLPKDHPIYNSFLQVPPGSRPRLEAIGGPCWLLLLYAPDGLSCPWDVARFSHPNFKLAANVAAYVTGLERLPGKLEKRNFIVPSQREPVMTRGAFVVGQVVHTGGWKPHRKVWSKVLDRLSREASVTAYSRPLAIDLDRDSPFKAHMLNIIGSGEFELSEEARRKLKLYLERGGFVFAEAACGSERFDRSLRRLVRQLFPDCELKTMPLGHPLLRLGRPLGEVRYNRAVRREVPDLTRPVLEYVEKDGRTVLVYSKYDLSCAVAGYPCFNCRSVLEPSASELLMKIVLYALSG